MLAKASAPFSALRGWWVEHRDTYAFHFKICQYSHVLNPYSGMTVTISSLRGKDYLYPLLHGYTER